MKHHVLQLTRFGLVGSINTAVDVGLYTALTRSSDWLAVHYVLTATITFLLAGITGFLLHKHWTFRDKRAHHHRQVIQFYAGSAAALAINNLILWQLVNAGTHDLISKLIASVGAGAFNFLFQKLFTFRHHQPAVEPASQNQPNALD